MLMYKINMTHLKKLREKHGISVRALADRLSMAYPYLSKVENDHETISRKNLEKISKEFNEPLDLLLIAHGYLPEHTREARKKDAEAINKALKKISQKIIEG